jgi:selenocysteine lyase/cysteine desulfurase
MLVVDAIQSTGACPVNVRESNIDFFATGGQKWMMSPSGIGFAYINPAIKHLVEPTYVATSSIEYDFKNFLNYKLNFRNDGAAYENSTPNTLGMIGMESSIELFLKLGVENIFKHILSLQDLFMKEMDADNYVIDSDLSPKHRSNILIFSHKEKANNENVQKFLESKNIFIALREGYLRMAAHLFNNEDDILALSNALEEYK